MDGIGPSFEAYESPVLPLNYTDMLNKNQYNIFTLLFKSNAEFLAEPKIRHLILMLRGPELHGRLKVMSLANYCYSTPLLANNTLKTAKNQVETILYQIHQKLFRKGRSLFLLLSDST